MGAQKIILGELATEFGGSAAAAGQTFGGQMEIIKNQLGNVKESIGTAMLPALQQLATAFGPMLVTAMQNLASWITTTLMPALTNIVNWITANWPQIQATITTAIANIRAFVEPIINVLLGLFQQTGDKTTWLGQTWSQIAGVITSAATLIQTIVVAVFTALKGFIATHGTEINQVLTGAWDMIKASITGALAVIQGIINLGMALLKGDWSGVWTALQGIVTSVMDMLKGVVGGAIAILQGIFGGLIEQIGKKLAPAFQSLNDDVLTPVANAFDAIGAAIGRVIDFVADLIKKFTQIVIPPALNPGSPTPFEMGLRGIGKAMQDLTAVQLPAFGGGLQLAPAMAGGGNTFNVTVNAGGGDPQAIGLAVGDAVRRAARALGGAY